MPILLLECWIWNDQNTNIFIILIINLMRGEIKINNHYSKLQVVRDWFKIILQLPSWQQNPDSKPAFLTPDLVDLTSWYLSKCPVLISHPKHSLISYLSSSQPTHRFFLALQIVFPELWTSHLCPSDQSHLIKEKVSLVAGKIKFLRDKHITDWTSQCTPKKIK